MELAKQHESKTNVLPVAVVFALAVAGLMIASFQGNWIAGSLGISAAAAAQIVAAIKAGKNAATVIGAVAGGGIASAVTATVTWAVFHYATEVAVS